MNTAFIAVRESRSGCWGIWGSALLSCTDTHQACSGLAGALGPQACVLYSAKHLKETILYYQP